MASSKSKNNTDTSSSNKPKVVQESSNQKQQNNAVASKDKAKAKAKDSKLNKKGKTKLSVRIKEYFKGVRSEIKRVVWPTKEELIKYTIAVVGMLLFFGILIALVDAAIIPALYGFSGLRG